MKPRPIYHRDHTTRTSQARYGRLAGLVFMLLVAWRLLSQITRESKAVGDALGTWDGHGAPVDGLTRGWYVATSE